MRTLDAVAPHNKERAPGWQESLCLLMFLMAVLESAVSSGPSTICNPMASCLFSFGVMDLFVSRRSRRDSRTHQSSGARSLLRRSVDFGPGVLVLLRYHAIHGSVGIKVLE